VKTFCSCFRAVSCVLQVEEFSAALEEVLVKKEDGMKYMPELYAVPADKVNESRVCDVCGSPGCALFSCVRVSVCWHKRLKCWTV